MCASTSYSRRGVADVARGCVAVGDRLRRRPRLEVVAERVHVGVGADARIPEQVPRAADARRAPRGSRRCGPAVSVESAATPIPESPAPTMRTSTCSGAVPRLVAEPVGRSGPMGPPDAGTGETTSVMHRSPTVARGVASKIRRPIHSTRCRARRTMVSTSTTPTPGRGGTTHDRDTGDRSPTPSGTGCVECLAAGGWWFHLRRCAACGHIGCCDTSPAQHATAHWRESGHP